MKIRTMVEELKSIIKQKWGVGASISITIHQYDNKYTVDEARAIGEKIADEFDDTLIENESSGIHWLQVNQGNENYTEITVFWNDENEA